MPDTFKVQTEFTAGELSPTMQGRVDFAKYNSGADTIDNFMVIPQGGLLRRGGTKYINTGKTAGKAIRLVRFEFSVTQAYMLEFGENYIRIYRDLGIIENPPGTPVEVVTTYTEAELNDLQFTQSADTLYIVHKDHAPATLTRSSHTSWTLANISFTATPSTWGAANYPQVVTFYEQRLWFAATPNEPQTLWASKSGDYTNFTTGSGAGDSLEYTIATDQVNVIRWMSPGKILMVGTTGGEFKVSASSLDEAITPTNVRIVRESSYGSHFTAPVRVDDSVIYVQRSQNKIRQLVYSFENDAYISPELTLLAPHITNSGTKFLAFQANPFTMIWSIQENGTLTCLTYLRDQEVIAWHNHTLGGVSDSDGNPPVIESMAVLPAPDGEKYDELWLSVKRYINSTTVRTIEVVRCGLECDEPIDKAFFVDSGLSYSGAATDTFSGLNHLEGETVSVLADGATHPDVTVSSGSVTLNYTASEVHIGYSYSSDYASMNIESGETLGFIKRASTIYLQLLDSVGIKIGSSFTNLDIVPFRSSADAMDSSVGLFTGIKELSYNGGYEQQQKIYFRQDQPLPLTVLSMSAKVTVNAR